MPSILGPFAALFIFAMLVEGLIERFGQPIPSTYKPWAAGLLAIVICVFYNVDLLAMFGYQATVPYVGAVITGAVISRGANYLNDFISAVQREPAPPAPPAQPTIVNVAPAVSDSQAEG